MSLLVRLPDHSEEASLEDLDLYIVMARTESMPGPSVADVRGMSRLHIFRGHRRRRNRLLTWLDTLRKAFYSWISGPHQQIATLGFLVAAFAAVAGVLT